MKRLEPGAAFLWAATTKQKINIVVETEIHQVEMKQLLTLGKPVSTFGST
jgi:hypothetical protein